MALYFSGNFQVFKEDLALWVALVYDTQSKNSQYNNAQFMIYKLYIFAYHHFSFFAYHHSRIHYISFFT